MSTTSKLVVVGISLYIMIGPAMAVEGALGRTIPGIWIQPQMGVVGPAPGFSFSTVPIGYMGRIGGGRLVPIGGALFGNVEADLNINLLAPSYVYKTETNKLSLSSTFMGVVSWVGAEGSINGNLFSASRSQSNAGVGDVIIAPLTAGIHFSETNHLAISTMIFAPTGQFRPANLTNTGMGEWTFTPNVAHTYIWKKHKMEFDNYAGFDIYTRNPTTQYKSGTVFHWDGMAIYSPTKKFGVGAIGGTVQQFTDDTGSVAARLNGFQGSTWGVGPMVLYVAKLEKPSVVLQLRWINEFEVTNLLKGNAFLFGLSFKFN